MQELLFSLVFQIYLFFHVWWVFTLLRRLWHKVIHGVYNHERRRYRHYKYFLKRKSRIAKQGRYIFAFINLSSSCNKCDFTPTNTFKVHFERFTTNSLTVWFLFRPHNFALKYNITSNITSINEKMQPWMDWIYWLIFVLLTDFSLSTNDVPCTDTNSYC